MVRAELAAPASPLWPQWQWKDDRVIGRTFRDREINSKQTRHGLQTIGENARGALLQRSESSPGKRVFECGEFYKIYP